MSKTALITGSSRGLGKELALTFARNGYDIILHGRDESNLKKVQEQIVSANRNCYIVYGDLKESLTLDKLSLIAQEKDISILINNAAITCPGLSFEKLNEQQVTDMVLVNLIAPINLSKRIYPLFLEKGYGSIVNINALAGLEPKRFRSIYCSTKYGLRGFSDSLRIEAKEHNLKVIDIFLSKMRNTTQDSFGMNLTNVSEVIYEQIHKDGIEELIIDGRQEEYRHKIPINTIEIDGRPL